MNAYKMSVSGRTAEKLNNLLQLIQHLVLIVLIVTSRTVEGHGRLLEPPSRASAWRLGFATPINYNDNELFCGGFNVRNGKRGVPKIVSLKTFM